MKIAKFLAVTALATSLVAAVSTESRAQNETLLGSLLGGAAGAGIGAAFGGGKGAAIGGASGLLLGALAGYQVGKRREYSRPPPNYSQGYYQAPPPTYAYQPAPAYATTPAYTAPAPAYTTPAPAYSQSTSAYDPSYCRQFNQRIVIDGIEQNAYGTACRQPDGTWKIIN